MKFFADTADTGEIRDLAATGLLDGVTTNPSLVARTGKDFRDVLEAICALVEGPVSAEVTATDAGGMVAQGRDLAGVADNVVVGVGGSVAQDGGRSSHSLKHRATTRPRKHRGSVP